ncbi:hypothetical protein [Streptomyces sp. NPDC094049]|uniref:hypothetical protein n=1 Tax=Streptomyces sp. NPDC094049 TaxID=3154987 RepID=UPI0033186E5B
MADERYQWLDQEAAERLLGGAPVGAPDGPARVRAARLADALDTVRTPALPSVADIELPGEAAALAAFREASAGRAASAARAPDADPEAAVDLGRVRLAPVVAPVRRWGRSVRYGLAAAAAAVAVGGVAVAAGSGMLPLRGPSPAGSVTAGESVDPLLSEHPSPRGGPGVPSARPGGDGRLPGPSPSAGPRTGAPDGRTRGGASEPGGGEDPGGTGPGKLREGTAAREKAAKACRAYRAGKLDAPGRKRLLGALNGGETLGRYCDRLLGTAADEHREDGDEDEDDRPWSGARGKGDGGNDDRHDDRRDDGHDDGNPGKGRGKGQGQGKTDGTVRSKGDRGNSGGPDRIDTGYGHAYGSGSGSGSGSRSGNDSVRVGTNGIARAAGSASGGAAKTAGDVGRAAGDAVSAARDAVRVASDAVGVAGRVGEAAGGAGSAAEQGARALFPSGPWAVPSGPWAPAAPGPCPGIPGPGAEVIGLLRTPV